MVVRMAIVSGRMRSDSQLALQVRQTDLGDVNTVNDTMTFGSFDETEERESVNLCDPEYQLSRPD